MSLFGRLGGKAKPSGDSVLYAFTFKVTSGTAQIPPPMRGAYVVAYSTGDSPTTAAERAWQELGGMGYVVEDMDPKGGAVSLARWDEHVAERWSEFTGHFPAQDKVLGVIETKNAIFGPFAGFE